MSLIGLAGTPAFSGRQKFGTAEAGEASTVCPRSILAVGDAMPNWWPNAGSSASSGRPMTAQNSELAVIADRKDEVASLTSSTSWARDVGMGVAHAVGARCRTPDSSGSGWREPTPACRADIVDILAFAGLLSMWRSAAMHGDDRIEAGTKMSVTATPTFCGSRSGSPVINQAVALHGKEIVAGAAGRIGTICPTGDRAVDELQLTAFRLS